MTHNQILFRGQIPHEEVIAISRKHWVAILPEIVPFFLYLGISAVIFILLQNPAVTLPDINDPYYQIAIAGYVILSGYITHKFFLHLVNYFTFIVLVTNFRVIEMKKTIFVQDTKESIDIKQIQNVEFIQEGLVENLLKFGSVKISMGNTEIKTLTQVPNPDFHFRLINRLMNEAHARDHKSIKKNEEAVWSDLRARNEAGRPV